MAYEILKPTQHDEALKSDFTIHENSYDNTGVAGDTGSFSGCNQISLTSTPDYDMFGWQSGSFTGSYTQLTLKVKFSGTGLTNDTWAIRYSLSGSGGPYTYMFGPTSQGSDINADVSASLPLNTNFSTLEVDVDTVKVGGPDTCDLRVWDVWTEGIYPVTRVCTGTSRGQSKASALLSVKREAKGTSQGRSTAKARLGLKKQIKGTSHGGACICGATPKIMRVLAATVKATAVAAALLVATLSPTAVSVGQAHTTALLDATTQLRGTSAGQSTAAAVIGDTVPIDHSGSVHAQSTARAYLSNLTRDLLRRTDGLLFYDDFNRAGGSDPGNGWEKSGSVSLVDNKAVAGGGLVTWWQNIVAPDNAIIQANFQNTGGGSANYRLFLRGESTTNPFTRYLLDSNDVTNVLGVMTINNDVFQGGLYVPSAGYDTPLTVRFVTEPSGSELILRGYYTGTVDALDEIDNDVVLGPTYVESGSLLGSGVSGIETNAAFNVNIDEFMLMGRFVTFKGLQSKEQVRVIGPHVTRSLHTAVGDTVQIDIDTFAIPLTSVEVWSDDNRLIGQATPSDGVWGGDIFWFAVRRPITGNSVGQSTAVAFGENHIKHTRGKTYARSSANSRAQLYFKIKSHAQGSSYACAKMSPPKTIIADAWSVADSMAYAKLGVDFTTNGYSVGQSQASAHLGVQQPLIASAVGHSLAHANSTKTVDLTGTSVGRSDANAQGTVKVGSKGSTHGQSQAFANLSPTKSVVGSSIGDSLASARIALTRNVVGTSHGSSVAQVKLDAAGGLFGRLVGQSTAVATILQTKSARGYSDGSAITLATLDKRKGAKGTAQGRSQTNATITVAQQQGLFGTSIGESVARSQLSLTTGAPITIPVPALAWAWWRADYGVTTSGTDVTQWDDKTAHGRHLTQSLSTQYPQYVSTTSSFNDQPAISFDGSNDFMQVMDTTNPISGSALTFAAIIIKPNEPTWVTGYVAIQKPGSRDYDNLAGFDWNGGAFGSQLTTDQIEVGPLANPSDNLTFTEPGTGSAYHIVGQFQDGVIKVWRNGVLQGSISKSMNFDGEKVTIGARDPEGDGTYQHFSLVDYHEVIIYQGSLTTTNTSDLFDYLDASLSGTLGSATIQVKGTVGGQSAVRADLFVSESSTVRGTVYGQSQAIANLNVAAQLKGTVHGQAFTKAKAPGVTEISGVSRGRSAATARLSIGGTTVPPQQSLLWGWWRADSGVVESGGAVSEWQDKTVHGHHLTQSVSANYPTYVASTGSMNDQPVIHFDGTNDLLNVLDTADPLSGSALTFGFIINKPAEPNFVTAYFVATKPGQRDYDSTARFNYNGGVSGQQTTTDQVEIGPLTSPSDNLTFTEPGINSAYHIVGQFQNGTLKVWKNGSLLGEMSKSVGFDSPRVIIGGRDPEGNSSYTHWSLVDYLEVFVYRGELTTTETSELFDYLDASLSGTLGGAGLQVKGTTHGQSTAYASLETSRGQTGVAHGRSLVYANLNAGKLVSGVIHSKATANATLQVNLPTNGTALGQSQTNARIALNRSIKASEVQGRSTVSGIIAGAADTLNATSRGQSSVSARLQNKVSTKAISVGQAEASANLFVTKRLAGVIHADAEVSAKIAKTSRASGTSVGTSQTAGRFVRTRNIAGTSNGQAQISTRLRDPQAYQLTAIAHGQSQVTGDFAKTSPFKGTAHGRSQTTALLSAPETAKGTSVGQSQTSARITLTVRPTAVAYGQSTANASLVEFGIAGTTHGQSQASAVLLRTRPLAGTSVGQNSSAGTITLTEGSLRASTIFGTARASALLDTDSFFIRVPIEGLQPRIVYIYDPVVQTVTIREPRIRKVTIDEPVVQIVVIDDNEEQTVIIDDDTPDIVYL